MSTDEKRLRQVLRNLLSNAFKFTKTGARQAVSSSRRIGWNLGNLNRLNSARAVVAFSVSDTGIGVAADKLKIIFEAFQ